MARCGEVWLGEAGMVWFVTAGWGVARRGSAGKVRCVKASQGLVSQGVAWTGTSRKQKGEWRNGL